MGPFWMISPSPITSGVAVVSPISVPSSVVVSFEVDGRKMSEVVVVSVVVGAVVVNYRVPVPLASKVKQIRAALDGYRTLQPQAGYISSVYQQELVLFSLVIVLFAIWWGFRGKRRADY